MAKIPVRVMYHVPGIRRIYLGRCSIPLVLVCAAHEAGL